MTEAQKISYIQTIVDDENATDALVEAYLEKAKAAILRRRYPFGVPDNAVIGAQYDMLQAELAIRYFYRSGGDGELVHNENGINRTYGSVNDEDLLMEVTPFAKVI